MYNKFFYGNLRKLENELVLNYIFWSNSLHDDYNHKSISGLWLNFVKESRRGCTNYSSSSTYKSIGLWQVRRVEFVFLTFCECFLNF